MTLDEVRMRALQLSPEDRELLGVELLGSLDTSEDRALIDAAWADEIMRRSDAYHSGKVELHDASETADRLRQRLVQKTRP